MTGVLLLLALQASAASFSFEEAKTQADLYEKSLSPSANAELVKAQGSALGVAFEQCGHLGEPPIKSFTVVAHVNEIGSTDRTWLKGDTALAQCVERKLATAKFPANGGNPFYTSYELTFEP